MFDSLVSVLTSDSFPHLRELYWSIHIGGRRGGIAFPDYPSKDLERLLKGAEKIVRKLGPQLQDIDLAPQYSVYKALADRAKSNGARFGRSPKSWDGERFWYPVKDVVNDEADSNRPGVETEGLGFWVRDGMDDLPFVCTLGEGYSGN